MGQVLRDEPLMYPGLFGPSWGDRRNLAEETAVVGGRGLVDPPGGRISAVQMIAGMPGAGCSGVELGASHIQVGLHREHFGFCMEVWDRGRFGASGGNA